MRALFVIYPNDPVEYFDQMAKIARKVELEGGSWTVEKKIFTDWAKPPREFFEYRFRCEKMESIIV